MLDQGALVEQGTHEELLRHKGLYARLWQEQGGDVAGAGVQYVGVEASRLRGVPLFTGLDPDLLATLARRLAVERYPADQTIVHEGQVGDKLYIIHSGQVDVVTATPGGHERALATLREGDHFGEMALLYDLPRTATIRARTPVQLYSLDKGDFATLLRAVPRLRDQLERAMTERVQASAG